MPKFELGQIVATPGALQAIRSSGQTPSQFLRRHVNGDWGEHLDGHDYKQNQIALREGGRLLSACRHRNDKCLKDCRSCPGAQLPRWNCTLPTVH